MGLDSFVSYRWEVDGVAVSTDSVFDYKAIKAGMNEIQLFVQTKNGCIISLLDSFFVYPLQSTAFFIDDECLNIPVSPVNFSTITPPSTFAKFEWFLDGNYVSSSIQPSLTPANIGTHTLKLRTISTDGCVDSVLNSFLVHPLPNSSFTSTLNLDLSTKTNSSKRLYLLFTQTEKLIAEFCIISTGIWYSCNSPKI